MLDDDCGTRRGLPIRVASWQEAASLLARAAHVTAHATRNEAPRGFRMIWRDQEGLVSGDVACGAHVVLGRHSECDVPLEDPTAPLRSALLRVVAGDDGTPELRVYDLCTGVGFQVDGDETPRFVHTTRAMTALRVAGKAIAVVPYEGAVHRELSEIQYASAASRAGRGSTGTSSLREETRIATRIFDLPTPRHAWVEVTLRSRGRMLGLRLSREQLEHPVLVGRYDRCAGGDKPVLSSSASRVHLALLADGEDVLVLDTASTNGLHHRGSQVRMLRVSDAAEVELSPEDHMTVRRCRA